MARLEDIGNHVVEEDDVAKVYCPTCGDPDKGVGWAEPEWVMAIGWKKVGDKLCCSTYCAAIEAGHDEEKAQELRGEAAWNDPISEEAVAAMPSMLTPSEFELDALEEFGGK